jgi:hypothetical protein
LHRPAIKPPVLRTDHACCVQAFHPQKVNISRH